MVDRLRVGIASQTPLVRMKRELEPGDEPLPLSELTRGVDYSVTPGGVARMIWALAESAAAHGRLAGDWVALPAGCSRDLLLGDLRLTWAPLEGEAAAAYKDVKEIAWEALNGMPPRLEDPTAATPEAQRFRESFSAWSEANARRVMERHAEAGFDLFYVNDWQHLPQGNMLQGAPAIMHFHAPLDASTPRGWAAYVRRCFDAFDGVIVSTDSYARYLRASGYERPVHRVYPWLDATTHVRPPRAAMREVAERFGIREREKVVLNIGRMDPIKGQDRLLRAWPRVLEAVPEAKLVLVGNGSFSSSPTAGLALSKGKIWRAKCEGIAKELGIERSVVFTGHLPQVDVEAMLARCDLFAFPSVGEGFGLAVAEAWLHNKPAVVSERAGIAELVRHGENGLLVDASDPRLLAEALIAGLRDEGSMGAAGRATALEHCDAADAARSLLNILEAHAGAGEFPEPTPTARSAVTR
jgi:glycosyltransferase involved in cell wall biosynthesis